MSESNNRTKLRTLALWSCGMGAGAMLLTGIEYTANGSKGDQPDMAKVAMTNLSTASFSIQKLNLELSSVEALEPDAVTGERPGAEFYGRSTGLVTVKVVP